MTRDDLKKHTRFKSIEDGAIVIKVNPSVGTKHLLGYTGERELVCFFDPSKPLAQRHLSLQDFLDFFTPYLPPVEL